SQARKAELGADLLPFFLIDAAVGLGGGDHGAHQHQREFGLALRRLRRMETGISRWRQQFGLARNRSARRRLAVLVILIGLVGEAANRRQPAEPHSSAGDLPARSGAKQYRSQ